MTHRSTYLILLTHILLSCSPKTTTDKDAVEQKILGDNHSTEHLLDKLNIPKSWTEITLVNNVWTYSIPCPKYRELQTILLTKVDNQEAVTWNTGTEGQWHALKK